MRYSIAVSVPRSRYDVILVSSCVRSPAARSAPVRDELTQPVLRAAAF